MRTTVYVDGFNLYYGSLRKTPYKWLDLLRYFSRTLPIGCKPICIKYFTARVSALPNDPLAPFRQDAYLRALKQSCGESLEIIEGQFQVKRKRSPTAANPSVFVEILNTEEKGSDVNLAVELVNDAWANTFDCAAIVSNDADLARALMITKRQRKKRVILYTPGFPQRRPLVVLSKWSHKQIGVNDADLAACQMPDRIPNTHLCKPSTW